MLYRNPVSGTLHPGSWVRPNGNTEFEVTQWFGCTGFEDEPAHGDCPHFHRGLDLWNGRAGDHVKAVAPGVVTRAGPDPYSGNAIHVWIKHTGGWYSGYYHLKNEIVSVGQTIILGQTIGYVGSSGWSTAPHLHFEILANDDAWSVINPWPRFIQNVTCHPAGEGVNIRSSASTAGTPFAITKADGHIYHGTTNLGPTGTWRKWGESVTGGSYTINGVQGNIWHKIWLDDGFKFIARPLIVLSDY